MSSPGFSGRRRLARWLPEGGLAAGGFGVDAAYDWLVVRPYLMAGPAGHRVRPAGYRAYGGRGRFEYRAGGAGIQSQHRGDVQRYISAAFTAACCRLGAAAGGGGYVTDTWLLPALLLVPLVGALTLLVSGSRSERWATPFGLGVQSLGLVVTLVAVGEASRSLMPARCSWSSQWSWIPELGVDFRLGVDGISLPLVVLTSLLGWCTAVYTVRHVPEPGRARAFVGICCCCFKSAWSARSSPWT